MARIVRNMGGLLRVDSEPLKGSKFTLSLRFPIYNSDQMTPSTDNMLEESSGPIKMMKNETNQGHLLESSPLSFIEGQQIVMKDSSLSSSKPKTVLEHSAYAPTTEAKQLWTQLQTRPSPPSENTSLVELKILYAEDDIINQQIIEKRLKKMNYKVTVCQNGMECVELFKKNSTLYDAILMDVQMPLCNGLEATSLIREFEQKRDSQDGQTDIPLSHRLNQNRIPIFAVSASVYESDRDACLHHGMSGYLNKPVDVKLLDLLLKSSQDASMKSNYTTKSLGDLWDGAWFP